MSSAACIVMIDRESRYYKFQFDLINNPVVEITFNLHTDGVADHFCLGLHLPITLTLSRSQGFIRGGEVRPIDV